MEDKFELEPLLFEMTHNVKEIERNIEFFIADELFNAVEFIERLTNPLQEREGKICVLHNICIGKEGEVKHFQVIDIPFDIINSIHLS